MADFNEAEAKRPYPLATRIGTSGLRNFSGYIREEYQRELVGRKGRQTYFEMANGDSTAGAILFSITMLLRSVRWTFLASDPDNEEAVEAAKLVEDMLVSDMQQSWPEVIDSACSMFTYGFAVSEILWKKRNGFNATKPWLSSDFDDGLWAPRAIASRSQRTIDRWVYDEEENLLGFVQTPHDGPQVVVPIRRCLHFRTTAELDNPEGRPALRSAYRAYYFLKRLQEIEGIGIERDLAGYPVLKVPSDVLDPTKGPEAQAARVSYEAFLKNVRRDEQEGVLLPSDRDDKGNAFYEFSLISSGGSRALKIDESINRYQRDIARSVMADFIFLGADGGGSLALGKSKIQTFGVAMRSYLDHIAAVVNESLIPQIWRVNGLNDELRPKAQPGEIEPADLASLGAFLTSMAGVGFNLAGDRALENLLRAKAELTPAPDPEDLEDFAPTGPSAPGEEPPDENPDDELDVEEGADEDATDDDVRKGDWSSILEGFDAR
jgi:hypothetical protein